MNYDTYPVINRAFLRAYIECALWSSTDESTPAGGEPLDKNYSADDIAAETLAEMAAECADFQAAQREDLADIDDTRAGHDFWLTRNRHGAGFWDRGLGAVGERLTAAAHVYGSVDLFVCADGKIRS